jgi:hypothetical protein
MALRARARRSCVATWPAARCVGTCGRSWLDHQEAARLLCGFYCLRKDSALGVCVAQMRPGRMQRPSFPVIVSAARCELLSKNGAMTNIASCASSSQCSKSARSCLQNPTDRPAAPCGFILPSLGWRSATRQSSTIIRQIAIRQKTGEAPQAANSVQTDCSPRAGPLLAARMSCCSDRAEPGSKELRQMCSLHADRLQEGR